MKRRAVAVLLALALAFATSAFAQDETSDFRAEDKSVEALYEALLMSASQLIQEFGPADAELSFGGTVDGNGWSASLSGTYAGEPFDISLTGKCDAGADSGSFTSTGTYGESTWDGTGSWKYTAVDKSTLDMTWDSEASIWDPRRWLKPDKHFVTPKRWARSVLPDGSIHTVDSGSYRSTYFGIPFGRIKPQISDMIERPNPGGPIVVAVAIELPEDGVHLTSTADLTSGKVTGKMSLSSKIIKDPVPEEVKAKAEAQIKAGPGSDQ